jgi:hypothetical protein
MVQTLAGDFNRETIVFGTGIGHCSIIVASHFVHLYRLMERAQKDLICLLFKLLHPRCVLCSLAWR